MSFIDFAFREEYERVKVLGDKLSEIDTLINWEAFRPIVKDMYAPLGLAFYYGNSFPKEYIGNLFVAYHGSWNRRVPTGYKIVSIDMNTFTVKDFATGWLQDNNVLGRPVDIIVANDGSLFVSDDNAGKIYRIYYEEK
jgi:glucose/arabinose dehydrogenase